MDIKTYFYLLKFNSVTMSALYVVYIGKFRHIWYSRYYFLRLSLDKPL